MKYIIRFNGEPGSYYCENTDGTCPHRHEIWCYGLGSIKCPAVPDRAIVMIDGVELTKCCYAPANGPQRQTYNYCPKCGKEL